MTAAAAPAGNVAPVAGAPTRARRDFATKLFGYDIFISFALGPAPRGSLSYASDLARRLRERDFTVFFSEDEAPPGEELGGMLRKALHGSRALVVIANRGTLLEPRWVRIEVESFRGLSPARPVIPISVGDALKDSALAADTEIWLPFRDRIWIDETQEAVDSGVASADVVDRLAVVPRRVRSNVKWRWLVRTVGAALLLLAGALGVAAKIANDNDARARAQLRRSVSLGAAAEAQGMVSGQIAGGHERALQQLLAAQAIGAAPVEVGSAMLSMILDLSRETKLLQTISVIRAAAFAPGGEAAGMVTGGANGRVQRWDARTLRPIGEALAGPTAEVYAVAYSRDGAHIAAGDLQGRLWLWNAASGALLSAPPPADEFAPAIRSLAFMPNGRRIVTGSVGGALRFWDAHTARPLGEPLQGHGEVITAVAVSADGRRIVSGGDYHLQLWTEHSGGWTDIGVAGVDDPPVVVGAVAFSLDGLRIASGANDGLVRLADGLTGKPVGEPLRARGAVSSLRFTADGTHLLSGGAGGALELWDIENGHRDAEWMRGQDGAVTAIDFDPDSGQAVTGGEDGMLRIWDASAMPATGEAMLADAADGELQAALQPACQHPPQTRSGGDPSGRILAWGADCTTWIARAAGVKTALQRFGAPAGEALGAPAVGHAAGPVRDANSKEPKIAIVSAAISRDRRHVVSGSEDGTIQRWSAPLLQPVGELLRGHDGAVTSVAFSTDGRIIASAGKDGTLRLWDAASGHAIGRPLWPPGGVELVAFTADGDILVAQGPEGTLRAWPAPARWPALLCAKLARGISLEDWNNWLSSEIPFAGPCAANVGAATRPG